jgi:transcriptional regulator with XRE-family HTH domain
MANDRLRDALLRHGLTPDDLAVQVGVDRKTVERWITQGRVPYRKHRHQVAAAVRESESYLWPDALDSERRSAVAKSEVVELYPHRANAPADLWMQLLDRASEQIDVLVYAALFLPEQNPRLVAELKQRAETGAKIRLMFGDPDSPAVAERGREEGIEGAIAHKIRNTLVHYEPLAAVAGVDVRLHRTTLYHSIYRFDDEMLVSLHVHGLPAAHAPLLHLRRLSEGDLFTTYTEAYDRIWSEAAPAWP